ncbi:MAG: flagellar hook-length control protein FliK [Bosea sp. (in: a-proteobacteria)]
MAALEINPIKGIDGARAQTLSGQLTRLDADGSAELTTAGRTVSLSIQPEALARAQAALGSHITLKIEAQSQSGLIQARIIDVGESAGQGAAATRAQAAQSSSGASQVGAGPPQGLQDSIAPAARMALAQSVARASANQTPLGPLYASLEGIAASDVLASLPASAQRAVARALDLRLDADTLNQEHARAGSALGEAVARSGLGHEARLASALPQQAGLAAADLKSALTQLISSLAALTQTPEDAQTSRSYPPPNSGNSDANLPTSIPPHRDAAPRGQAPLESNMALASADTKEIAATLARQAEGALDRVRLLQAASLPEAKAFIDPAAQPPQRWHLELPMMLPDGRTQILPLRIEREAARRNAAGQDGATWRVRFALDGEPLGAVAAIVTWRMRQISVSIFAEREDTRSILRAEAAALRHNLDHAGVDDIEIDIASGRPVEPKPLPGRLLDRVT